jgi:hypothetical protein
LTVPAANEPDGDGNVIEFVATPVDVVKPPPVLIDVFAVATDVYDPHERIVFRTCVLVYCGNTMRHQFESAFRSGLLA